MDAKDQLLGMLKTIDETELFLRKRCAAGMAGQSLQLFEDLFSLIGMIQHRFAKSEYLPMRTPIFRDQIDALAAVELLDQVQDWVADIRNRIKRAEMRQQLARGGIFDAAAEQGKPFAKAAKELAKLARGNIAKPVEQLPVAPPQVPLQVPPEPVQKGAIPEETPHHTPPKSGKRLDTAQESAHLARAMGVTGLPDAKNRSAAAEKKQHPESNEEPVTPARSSRMRREPEPAPQAARPMGAAPEPEHVARPMGAKREEPEPASQTARPMGSSPEPEHAARPMGAAPEAQEKSAAQPMGKGSESAAANTIGDGRNATDRTFAELIAKIEPLNEKQVAGRMIAAFPKLENRYKMVMLDYLRRFPYWGPLDPDRDIYGVFSSRAAQLVHHRRDFEWLYDKLADYRSKRTLLAILDNWFSFNFKELTNVKERIFANYFDFDLLQFDPAEVFVDLGACTGEVTQAFAQNAGGYRKIYCYEIAAENISVLRENTAALGNVEIRQKGVCDRAGISRVSAYADPSTSRLSEEGSAQVETVTLDEDLKDTVSFLKINLEGGEAAALQGCASHIHRSHPKLVIRLDHQNEDLWRIPRMVDRLEPKYKLYLRHYGGNLVPAEYVLFAV